ncbi:hypothetical protein C2S51_016158 [Perilla frutescens var. frutescens]|nr:hypothetical protein C2S51_016158 [Perilla frutescens var. frutescens]
MVPLLTPAANGGGAVLSTAQNCSLKFVHPVPPLFSKRRPTLLASRLLKPLTLANATESSGGASTKPATTTTSSSSVPFDDQGCNPNPISLVGQENVPLEGVIQFEKPNSTSLLAKWGYIQICIVYVYMCVCVLVIYLFLFVRLFLLNLNCNCSLVAVLAGGDVAALLLFSAIGRFSHAFSVFDFETFKTADPFIAARKAKERMVYKGLLLPPRNPGLWGFRCKVIESITANFC